MILRAMIVTCAVAAVLVAAPRDSTIAIPHGFPNDLASRLEHESAAADLGAKLFHDPILSADRTVACVNCHDPGRNFTRNEARSKGVRGQETRRNVPTILNRALGTKFMWDGRADSLETMVLMPIENPEEMALPVADAVARLDADPKLRVAFESTFGRRPDREALGAALAAFVRSQLIGDSPVDAFHAGSFTALSDEARQGLWLFESRANCWKCHSGPNFSDESFHSTAVGAVDGKPEDGRFAVTHDEADRGRFKTPTLRGLTRTAPYMHDGSLATLQDVVEYYSRGGNPIAATGELVPKDPHIVALHLSDADKRYLIAFLEALSTRTP